MPCTKAKALFNTLKSLFTDAKLVSSVSKKSNCCRTNIRKRKSCWIKAFVWWVGRLTLFKEGDFKGGGVIFENNAYPCSLFSNVTSYTNQKTI